MLIALVWTWLEGISADEWTAAATWLTALVAATAAIVAARQLGEAREMRRAHSEATLRQIEEARSLRREEAAPYVVVYGEASSVDSGFIDLVIANLGRTAATDVRLVCDPPLQRAALESPLRVPESIPVLVPGQRFRTFWDSSYARHDRGLPKRHEVAVTFSDADEQNTTTYRYVLDWDILVPGSITTYGMHHAAKALREMNANFKSVTDARGLTVWARDGDARQQRIREEYERRERAADGEG